jgi:hypothetical protein
METVYLTGAIIFTLISPVLAFVRPIPYRGAIPPEAPILREHSVLFLAMISMDSKNIHLSILKLITEKLTDSRIT